LTTHLRTVESLIPYARNARKHSDAQIAQIAGSIKAFKFRSPIVVTSDGGIVCGHGRVLAARKLGMAEVPCVYADDLTENERMAYILADNKIAENATWDQAILNIELDDLFSRGFDLQIAGFTGEEIASSEGVRAPTEGLTDPDEVPEPPKTPVTKRGDIWLLGEHRVMCGDSTSESDVTRLMVGMKADMVFTDPPYNVGANMSKHLFAGTNNKSGQELEHTEWDKDFSIEKTINIIDLFAASNSSVYICTSHWLAGNIWSGLAKAFKPVNYCVWCKPNPMPSLQKRHWTFATELICYAARGKHTFNFPKEGHALSHWALTKVAKCDLHPTMKPISVPETAILHSSNSADVILDLFLGAGSTLIACEKSDRRCFGMEISEAYCDVIAKRWEDFTGKKAVLEC
jgi:DNA modification methylase